MTVGVGIGGAVAVVTASEAVVTVVEPVVTVVEPVLTVVGPVLTVVGPVAAVLTGAECVRIWPAPEQALRATRATNRTRRTPSSCPISGRTEAAATGGRPRQRVPATRSRRRGARRAWRRDGPAGRRRGRRGELRTPRPRSESGTGH